MKKIFSYIKNNPLLLVSLFILIFIPLYPKIPILDLKNTWVYIRIEDFIVLGITILFGILLLFKRATLKTPLTVPIFLFWTVGLLSTLIAILFIFPNLTNVFPQLAFLHYARRIEYIVLFFIAFSAVKSKSDLKPIIIVLTITLFAVVAYGFGQKYFGFPAFLTGNEEFAKGAPLRISANARVPSTFAGHYDLAAWLVILIPLFGSMVFAWKKIWVKLVMLFAAFSGLIMLLMTASRVSFAMYLLSITFMLILQKQKKWIIPVIIASLLVMNSFTGIASRFGNTISQVDLVIDARTGKAIGVVKNSDDTGKLVIEDIQSTGENLPEGTGFISAPGQEAKSTSNQITYKRRQISAGSEKDVTTELSGDFVVKRGYAYDVSFTTRFQGTWPRAINAFKRNILTGSGYSSISLASDNNYLRILGEVGILGMAAFLSIFLFYGIFVYRVLSQSNSKMVKSFVIGMSAGLFGLGLNASLIDVFEASKVAFVFWTLLGLTVGILYQFQKKTPDYFSDIKLFLTSVPMTAMYFILATFLVYGNTLKNYFIGDDFTWLRWAADCKKFVYPDGVERCAGTVRTITSYLTESQGFFYRPGTKIYFLLMYPVAWLNSPAYHVFSLLLHVGVGLGVYLLSYILLKKKMTAFVIGSSFVLLTSQHENILWISTTGHMIAAFCILWGLVLYIWSKKFLVLLPASFLLIFSGMFFHEFGIVGPLILIAYDLYFEKRLKSIKSWTTRFVFAATIPTYLIIRAFSNSHWSGGDYSYSLFHLPFNIAGNLLGYVAIILFGTWGMEFTQLLRETLKSNIMGALGFGVVGLVVLFVLGAFLKKKKFYTRNMFFGITFFVLSLLPFLGFGNITFRYSYLPSVGLLLFLGAFFDFVISKISNGKSRKIIQLIVFILFLGFISINVLSTKRIEKDWEHAGETTYNTVLGLYNAFPAAQATPPNPVFYFVNTPVRDGQAWVFPVGLEDALWFSFQNENLTVVRSPNLDSAFRDAEGSLSARIFEFDKTGAIEEVTKIIPTPVPAK